MFVYGQDLVKALNAIVSFVDTDKYATPITNTVHMTVSDKLLLMEATDRYTLGRTTIAISDQPEPLDVAVSAKDIKDVVQFVKGVGLNGDYPVEITMSYDGEPKLSVQTVDGARRTYLTVDDEYPRLTSIIPDRHDSMDTSAIIFNPDLLAKFGKAMKAYGSKAGLVLTFHGSNRPMNVSLRDVPEFEGVLMPLRDSI